jgi:hypothetical protein
MLYAFLHHYLEFVMGQESPSELSPDYRAMLD